MLIASLSRATDRLRLLKSLFRYSGKTRGPRIAYRGCLSNQQDHAPAPAAFFQLSVCHRLDRGMQAIDYDQDPILGTRIIRSPEMLALIVRPVPLLRSRCRRSEFFQQCRMTTASGTNVLSRFRRDAVGCFSTKRIRCGLSEARMLIRADDGLHRGKETSKNEHMTYATLGCSDPVLHGVHPVSSQYRNVQKERFFTSVLNIYSWLLTLRKGRRSFAVLQ